MKQFLFIFMILTLMLGLITYSVYAQIIEPPIPPSPDLGSWTFSTLGIWYDFQINFRCPMWPGPVGFSYVVTAPSDPANIRELKLLSPEGTTVVIGQHANEIGVRYEGLIWDFNYNYEFYWGNWRIWLEDPNGTGNIKIEEIILWIDWDANPVELSSFTASVIADNVVELNWVSETETNMIGYQVYRGIDNRIDSAEKITYYIIPASNTSITTHYKYQDDNVYYGNTYYYWLEAVDLDLTNQFYGPISVIVEQQNEIPNPVFTNSLEQNFPNPVPFNHPETTIKYSIRENVEAMSLTVYNIRGQLVRTLVPNGPLDKGEYQVIWNGRDDSGKDVASGVYFYRMTTPNFDQINKLMLLK